MFRVEVVYFVNVKGGGEEGFWFSGLVGKSGIEFCGEMFGVVVVFYISVGGESVSLGFIFENCFDDDGVGEILVGGGWW